MANRGDRKYAPDTSGSSNCNVLSVVDSHLSRSSKKRRQRQEQGRREESIRQPNLAVNAANPAWQYWQYQFIRDYHQSHYYSHKQYATPLQPYHVNSVAFSSHSNAALHTNLYPAYFHSQSNPQQQWNSQQSGNGGNRGLRYWENLATTRQTSKGGFNFTIMSYNVLAEDLVRLHPYIYTFHSPEALKWDLRWKNVLAEIKQFNPEVLCLQEVQGDHLEEYFSQLRGLGYESVYKQRTGVRTDGCAIFYKSNVLEMIEHETVEFNQPDVATLNRDNVGIIAKFAPKAHPKSEFVAATTHLLYNPKRHDVRLAQVQVLLAEIERIAFKPNSNSRNPYLPVILTGDFNSQPTTSVYEFITNGQLDYKSMTSRFTKHVKPLVQLKITDQCQHAALIGKRENNETLSRSEEVKLIELKHSEREDSEENAQSDDHDPGLFSSGTLSHKFSLKSVYTHGNNGDTEGTTYQDRWISVDYIFYSKDAEQRGEMTLMARYRLPTTRELGNLKIPNMNMGSDHLPLVAKFTLKV